MFSNTVIKLKRVIRFWLKIDLTPKLRALQKAELVAQADHVENEMEFFGGKCSLKSLHCWHLGKDSSGY